MQCTKHGELNCGVHALAGKYLERKWEADGVESQELDAPGDVLKVV